MTTFKPVHLPTDRRLDGKASQTLLRHYQGCPRSGYLYALHKGEASTPEMQRGSCFHAVAERATRACLDGDEESIPPEIVKAILNEALTEYHVPFEEHDLLREACYRWAAQTTITPARVIALETLFVLQFGDWQVRCKIDYAESLEDGAAIVVKDYKTSRNLPGFEELARKRPDGTLAAKSFQLVLYGLCLAFGVPVRIDTCADCQGTGWELTKGPAGVGMLAGCVTCGGVRGTPPDVAYRKDFLGSEAGKGTVEVLEPFGVATRAQRFDLSFVYPCIEINGEMADRAVTLTRLELDEYRQSLVALLARLTESERAGDWPAQVGKACDECPASGECPIPAEVRAHRGGINTVEEAREAAERYDRDEADLKARRKALKAAVDALGGELRYGTDKVWEFKTQVTRKRDYDAMMDAVRSGERVDPDDFLKEVKSTPFASRVLSAEEQDREVVA